MSVSHSGSGDEKIEEKTRTTDQVVEAPPELPKPIVDPPSQFSKREKWFIVILTACVGLFSPLTATIYYPAIPLLTKAFHKSTELINLTVTTYVILQGVAPMIWGPMSDHIGRRPVYAMCLLILAVSCVGLALVPTSNYGLLLGLRCIQACGSAATVAIGAGVIGDISTRAERGGFFGFFTLGPTAGPALGPVIGGALADRFGWRAIFWFLVIASSVCVLVTILFQPETLRHIVQSGRDNIFLIYKPVLPIIGRRTPPKPRTAVSTINVPKNPFGIFLVPDVLPLLYMGSVLFAIFYAVVVTISSLMLPAYPFLTETTLGLCFLSIGGGTVAGSALSGRILDFEYRRSKKKVEAKNANSTGSVDISREENFPLEKTRLHLAPYLIVVSTALSAGYGWCLLKKVNIAVPLILQFFIGAISIIVMNFATTLMIDLLPGQSSSVTACNNFLRCIFSAILVSVIDIIVRAIGTGWTYVLIAGFCLTSLPMAYVSMTIGPRHRIRRQRQREEQAAAAAARMANMEEKS
ncbi:MFS general substrate transporter [Agrocybe pediades]|nr:MFS general substrate transporter [Agrocybe pediades]